jgi:DNA polymerase-1
VRILLIDTDVLIYRFAYHHEHFLPWDENTWSAYGDFELARRDLVGFTNDLVETLAADTAQHYLSDTGANWRRDVYPQYKGHRAGWKHKRATLIPAVGPRRPMLYGALRQHCIDELNARIEPGLEGDDLLGLAATAQTGGSKIIISSDKDMRTVPGHHFNPDKPEEGLVTVEPPAAAHWHLTQTLTGDPTDGFSGCNGVGAVGAAKALDGLDPLAPEAWAKVVEVYEKKGMTEDDALMNARLAHVMQDGDYNFQTKEVTLWEPVR